MKLRHWRHLGTRPGPFATVSLDASTTDEAGRTEVQLRWEALRRELAGKGAPDAALDRLQAVVTEPTGRGGPAGRHLVATADDIVLDEVLPVAPVTEEALWGPVPQLLPGVRAQAAAVPHLVVRIDRTGADIDIHGLLDADVRHETVQGDHDELRAGPGDSWSQLRYQHRAEDSWERNATEVAGRVTELVRRLRPAVVLVAGDDKAVGAFVDHAPHELSVLVRRIGGGRADGVKADAFAHEVEQALSEYRSTERQALVDRWRQEEGRQENAVQGLDGVVDALRRGQVEEILLQDDHTSPLTLWVDPANPLALARDARTLTDLGVTDPQQVRADAALAWAALTSDAGITLLDQADRSYDPLDDATPSSLHLNDGIAALLRYSDASTPHESVPSMPGHGEGRGGDPVG